MKKCCTCKEEKELENFSVRKTGTPVSECKVCSAKRSNEWYWKNRQHSLDERKKHYLANREETLRKAKEHYLANYEEIRKRANVRNRTPEERAKANAKQKEWNKKNKDKLRKRTADWKRNNPAKARAHQYVLWAVRLNVIQKPSECQVCGLLKKVEAHHKDYSKPLEVLWVCKICHEQEHHKESYDSSSRHNLDVYSEKGKEVNGQCQ